MKRAATIAILIALTAPNGKPILLASDAVVALTAPDGHCEPPARTNVITSSGNICVREAADDIAAKLKKESDNADTDD